MEHRNVFAVCNIWMKMHTKIQAHNEFHQIRNIILADIKTEYPKKESIIIPESSMNHRGSKGNRKRRYSSSRSSSSTFVFLMAASASASTRHFFLGCNALLAQNRGRRRFLSRSLDAVETEYEETNTARNDNVPKLILPSHPDFPITSVMAPMVAASDYPFRVFLREHCGVDLTFTQMLLAKRFVVDPTFRKAHLDLYETSDTTETDIDELLPSQLECIGDVEEYREQRRVLKDTGKPFMRQSSAPLMVQLAGDNVDEMVRTAMMIYEHTEGKLHGIDLNCGCPQNIAKKGNYGGFLIERDFEKVTEILKALRKNLPPEVCVSAKIRLPMDDDMLVNERIPGLMESGISFLTLHGRTLKENKTRVEGAHIDRIKLAVETAHNLDPTFPVIANGGMENYDDVQRILQKTGASAAMSSEALLETPDLFRKGSMGLDKSPEDLFRKQLSFARDYLDVCTRVGPPLPGVLGFNKGGSFNVVRGHLFKFLHRYINTDHQDLRDKLAANGVTTMRTLGEARSLVEELESRYQNLSPEQWRELQSSSPLSSWYRRHRKPDRSVHVRNDLNMGQSSTESSGSSMEDRKREIRERLAKMKARKSKRSKRNAKQFV
jgi:tRNA-dihydrouridine synthase